jgi:hypothetical protein
MKLTTKRIKALQEISLGLVSSMESGMHRGGRDYSRIICFGICAPITIHWLISNGYAQNGKLLNPTAWCNYDCLIELTKKGTDALKESKQ